MRPHTAARNRAFGVEKSRRGRRLPPRKALIGIGRIHRQTQLVEIIERQQNVADFENQEDRRRDHLRLELFIKVVDRCDNFGHERACRRIGRDRCEILLRTEEVNGKTGQKHCAGSDDSRKCRTYQSVPRRRKISKDRRIHHCIDTVDTQKCLKIEKIRCRDGATCGRCKHLGKMPHQQVHNDGECDRQRNHLSERNE